MKRTSGLWWVVSASFRIAAHAGSGRGLTAGNYTSDPYFAPIVSQSLSNQNWASQRWLVQ